MMNDYPYKAAQNLLGSQQGLGSAQQGLLGQIAQAGQNQAIGSILRIRLPEPAAEAKPIMRYDVCIDELVPVTQEWVDEIGRVVRDKYLELKAARDEIQRLTILQSFQPESVVEKSEQDRLWHALRMAAGG